jgi:hypothetical protein
MQQWPRRVVFVVLVCATLVLENCDDHGNLGSRSNINANADKSVVGSLIDGSCSDYGNLGGGGINASLIAGGWGETEVCDVISQGRPSNAMRSLQNDLLQF